MKLHKKIAAVMLCAALLFATACGTAPAQEQSATPDSSTPTIRFLLRGTASGMDRVLDALYAQMDDDHRWQLDFTFVDSGDYAQQLARSLTAHDNYDFVFDAPWQSLAMQTEQKNYKNLKNYFNNPEYPALQAAFSEEYLAANTISGGLYAIPFTNTYYDVPGIFYRKDLLQTLGLPFDEITNRAEMEQYWAAVRKKGEMKPSPSAHVGSTSTICRRSPCGKTASGYPRDGASGTIHPKSCFLATGNRCWMWCFPATATNILPLYRKGTRQTFWMPTFNKTPPTASGFPPTTFCRRTVRGCFCWGSRPPTKPPWPAAPGRYSSNCEP